MDATVERTKPGFFSLLPPLVLRVGLADRLILGSLGHDAGNRFVRGLALLLGWGWLTL